MALTLVGTVLRVAGAQSQFSLRTDVSVTMRDECIVDARQREHSTLRGVMWSGSVYIWCRRRSRQDFELHQDLTPKKMIATKVVVQGNPYVVLRQVQRYVLD